MIDMKEKMKKIPPTAALIYISTWITTWWENVDRSRSRRWRKDSRCVFYQIIIYYDNRQTVLLELTLDCFSICLKDEEPISGSRVNLVCLSFCRSACLLFKHNLHIKRMYTRVCTRIEIGNRQTAQHYIEALPPPPPPTPPRHSSPYCSSWMGMGWILEIFIYLLKEWHYHNIP